MPAILIASFLIEEKRVLSSKVDNQSEVNLDVTALTSGMYIVEMESDSGKFSKKILKK